VYEVRERPPISAADVRLLLQFDIHIDTADKWLALFASSQRTGCDEHLREWVCARDACNTNARRNVRGATFMRATGMFVRRIPHWIDQTQVPTEFVHEESE
jgi:hypothetical protein